MSETIESIGLTVNGEALLVPAGTTVAGLVARLELDTAKVAVERNLEIVPRSTYEKVGARRGGRAGDRAFHRGRLMDTNVAATDVWTVAGRRFGSRLIVGTGKYKDLADHRRRRRGVRRGDGHGGGAAGEPVRPGGADAAGLRQPGALHLFAKHRGVLHRRGGGADGCGWRARLAAGTW